MAETNEKACCAPSCCSGPEATASADLPQEELVGKVRERYGRIAEGAASACCGVSDEAAAAGLGYTAGELNGVPGEANLGLGCGAPLAFLALQPGEAVLDLGSGPGLDALLAARQVGAEGRVIGVDMTPAMLQRARRAAARAEAWHVEFREGRLEALPVASSSVDAVTSNCVINLVPDKGAVFREVARVLRPGGRLVISDILLDGTLPAAIRDDLLAYVGCVSGALSREAYFALVSAAGLGRVEVLRDVDFLAQLAQAAPEEARRLQERTGIGLEQVLGLVRSVTFRASAPA
jgi:arsenite methyltransferase